MPIYCYKCFDCNHYDEITQKFTDDSLSECPKCGGNFKRVIRNVGVIFKGKGFHVNDYRSSGKAGTKSDKTETSDTVKTETAESAKTETKTESSKEKESNNKDNSKKKDKAA